jgi:hypothetical protein
MTLLAAILLAIPTKHFIYLTGIFVACAFNAYIENMPKSPAQLFKEAMEDYQRRNPGA